MESLGNIQEREGVKVQRIGQGRARYSTIRRETRAKKDQAWTMEGFYNRLTSPPAIVVVTTTFFGVAHRGQLLEYLQKPTSIGGPESVLYVALLVLSFVAGVKLFHSLILANRDYAHLESGISDIFIFIGVALFTSGSFLALPKISGISAEYAYPVALSFYALCAFIGCLNFAMLYFWKLRRDDPQIDYDIERKIQAVNAAIFGLLTVCLATALLVFLVYSRADLVLLLIACCCILLMFNVYYSDRLTFMPKFHLTNEIDSIENLLEKIRRMCHPFVAAENIGQIERIFQDGAKASLQLVRTIRASKDDIPEIVRYVLEEFSYVYEYVFDLQDRKVMARTLVGLIGNCRGLGSLGWVHFYWIENAEGDRVGLFKIDVNHPMIFHKIVELVTLPFILMWRLRSLRLTRILRRFSQVVAAQPSPSRDELRLTYLVIHKSHRNQGYGRSFLRLLHDAFLENETNDVRVERLTLYVRSRNRALRLFEKAGFKVKTPKAPTVEDPFEDALGRLLRMEMRRVGERS